MLLKTLLRNSCWILLILTSVSFAQRKRIQFGSTSYTVEDTVDLAGSPLSYSTNNTHIMYANAVLINSGAVCNAIEVTADSVFLLGNLIINSSNINIGIYLNGANNSRIEGVKVKNVNQQAIYINGGNQNIISDCFFLGSDSSFAGVFIYGNSSRNVIRSNIIKNWGYGVEEDESSTGYYNIVSDCQLISNGVSPAFYFRRNSLSIIQGNQEW